MSKKNGRKYNPKKKELIFRKVNETRLLRFLKEDTESYLRSMTQVIDITDKVIDKLNATKVDYEVIKSSLFDFTKIEEFVSLIYLLERDVNDTLDTMHNDVLSTLGTLYVRYVIAEYSEIESKRFVLDNLDTVSTYFAESYREHIIPAIDGVLDILKCDYCAHYNDLVIAYIASLNGLDESDPTSDEYVSGLQSLGLLQYADDAVLEFFREGMNVSVDTIEECDECSDRFYYIDDWRELSTLASSNGFTLERHNGDHGIFINSSNGKVVVIPQGRTIGKGLSIKIQKQIAKFSN